MLAEVLAEDVFSRGSGGIVYPRCLSWTWDVIKRVQSSRDLDRKEFESRVPIKSCLPGNCYLTESVIFWKVGAVGELVLRLCPIFVKRRAHEMQELQILLLDRDRKLLRGPEGIRRDRDFSTPVC